MKRQQFDFRCGRRRGALLSQYCGQRRMLCARPDRARRADSARARGRHQGSRALSMKNADGIWIGIRSTCGGGSQRKSDRLSFCGNRYGSASIDVMAGKFDVAVAALTVTAAARRCCRFLRAILHHRPWHRDRFRRTCQLVAGVRALTSLNFIQSVLALIGLALLVGLMVWLFERRTTKNSAEESPKA